MSMTTITPVRLPGPPRITRTPGVMGGVPCIDGTRVPVEQILACVMGGDAADDIYADYARIPFGAVELAIDWAKDNGFDTAVPDRRMPVAAAR